MSGYVICASCGARIKANRDRCLRCDQPLVAAAQAAPASSRDRALVAATVISLFVLIGGALVWQARTPPVDDTARPVAGAPPPRSAGAAAAAPAAPVTADTFSPVTSLDSQRLAAVAYAGQDFNSALAGYEQAVRRSPDDPEALNNLGQVLARLRRTGEAIEKFTRAVAIAPGKWAYHFNLAHAFGEQGRWDAAIGEYRIAARLFPDDYAVQYNLAMALHKKGDDVAAVLEFEQAIRLAPGEPTFHLSLAISLEKIGRPADARQEYARYLDMNPETPDAARLKAHIGALGGSAPAAKPPTS